MIENDILNLVETHLLRLADVDNVEQREVVIEDPDKTAGIFLGDWNPVAYEMTGQQSNHASISEYHFKIQHSSLHVDDRSAGVEGRASAKNIRRMLCGSSDFLLALAAISQTEGTYVERFQKLRVTRQRYDAAAINTNFLFMSVTEFTITTETVG